MASPITIPSQEFFDENVTGSVRRSFASKLGDWKSVTDHLPVGYVTDGSVDYTTQFQAALDALPSGGGTLLVPAGTYKANLRIKKSSTTLLGLSKSSIITAATSASPIIDITSDVTTGQLQGIAVIGLKLVGTGNAGIGIRMQATSPFIVEGSSIRDVWFNALATALSMVCTAAHETYQNSFHNLTSDTASGDAFSVDGVYNTFVGIKATGNSARAWVDNGWSTTLIGIDTDGVVRFTGQGARYTGITIETIFGAGPGANVGAVQLYGSDGSYDGITVTNVDNAKANYAVDVQNGPHTISSLRVIASSNDDAHRPQFPLVLAAASSGTVINAIAPGLFKIEDALATSILANWTFAGNLTGVSKAGKGFFKAIRLIQFISADRGDANQTLTVGTDEQIQRWATVLTANRTVTLSTTGAAAGDTFRVVRTGLGAFTLDVGGLKTIPISTAAFVDVAYTGAAWVLTGFGAL